MFASPADLAEAAVTAGADVVVAGHGVYRQPDPVAAMRALRGLAGAAA